MLLSLIPAIDKLDVAGAKFDLFVSFYYYTNVRIYILLNLLFNINFEELDITYENDYRI